VVVVVVVVVVCRCCRMCFVRVFFHFGDLLNFAKSKMHMQYLSESVQCKCCTKVVYLCPMFVPVISVGQVSVFGWLISCQCAGLAIGNMQSGTSQHLLIRVTF